MRYQRRPSKGQRPNRTRYLAELLERRVLLASNLVSDGSFETPLPATGVNYTTYSAGQSLGPWSVVGTGSLVNLNTAFQQTFSGTTYYFPAEDGGQAVDLTGGSSNSAVGLSQSISTTPGQTYTLSFWVGNVVSTELFGVTSTVNVKINGTLIASKTNSAGSPSAIWQQFVVPFTATGNSTTIAFFNGDGVADNYCGLDNVAVSSGAKLAFTVQPPPKTASNTALAPAIQASVEDASNNVDTTATGSVTLALNSFVNSGTGTLNGTLTEPLVNGVATFNDLSITQDGNYQLQASDTNGDDSGTSNKFRIGATGLNLTIDSRFANPVGVKPGNTILYSVNIQPAAGEALQSSDLILTLPKGFVPGSITGGGVFSGNQITWKGLSQTDTFDTKVPSAKVLAGLKNITVTGSDNVTYTDSTTDTASASNSVAASTDHLVVAKAPPSLVQVGAAIPLVLELRDSSNRLDTSVNGSGAQLSLNAASGAAPATTGVISANFVNGVATFSTKAGPIVTMPGDYTFTATDTASNDVSAVNTPQFKVQGDHLSFAKQVAVGDVSSPLAFTVKLLDFHNKLVTGENSATVTLTFTSLNGGAKAVLSGTTVATFSAGIANFTTTAGPQLNTAGSFRFTATETGTSSTSASVSSTASADSKPVKLAVDKLVLTTKPPTALNINQFFPLVVAVEDAKGNRRIHNTDPIQLTLHTISGGTNVVLANNLSQTTLPSAFGAITFSQLFLNSPGTYTITATELDPNSGQPVDTSNPVTTQPFKVTGLHLALLTQPLNSDPYQPIPLKFALEDAKNKVVTNNPMTQLYTLDLHVQAKTGGAGAQLISNADSLTFNNGIVDITSYIDDHPGQFVITGSVTSFVPGTAPIPPVTSHGFRVYPLHMKITQQPPSTGELGALPTVVELLDPSNKVDTYANASFANFSISASAPSGGATLKAANPDNLTIGFVNGVATAPNGSSGFFIDTAGTYQLSVSEQASGGASLDTPSVLSDPFTITPDHLAFTQGPPTTASANAPLPVTVSLEDANNKVVVNVPNCTLSLTVPDSNTPILNSNSVVVIKGVGNFASNPFGTPSPQLAAGTYTLLITLTTTDATPTALAPLTLAGLVVS